MRTRMAKVGAMKGTTAVTALGIVLFGLAGRSAGQTAGTDKTGGYIVFPKIVVDTQAVLLDAPTDTFVQISNTDQSLTARAVNCVWVNATSRCGAPGQTCPGGAAPPCLTSADCPAGLQCIPCWSETDFTIALTPGQPIGFHASQGEQLPCSDFPDPDLGCLLANQGAVSPAPGDPFIGELKCVQETQYNAIGAPLAARNDLKGEATIISANGTVLRTAAYNAWAFPTLATSDATDASAPICLGGFDAGGNPDPLDDPCGFGSCGLRYAGCPGVLILDHFFEGAPNVLGGAGTFVRTSLTLVPCSEAISTGATFAQQRITTAQFLIYNEFEQRYSASTRVQCYRDTPLADIDSRPGPSDDAFSIFSVAVQGTLTGQTRIRGVPGQEEDFGHGLIGVAQEHYFDSEFSTTRPVESAAYELHGEGERQQGDAVCRPVVLP